MRSRAGVARKRNPRALRWALAGAALVAPAAWAVACDAPELARDASADADADASAGAGGSAGSAGTGGMGGGDAATIEGTVNIATDALTPRIVSPSHALGVNYWSWARSYGPNLDDTVDLIKALKPSMIRIGGHNNDNNTPDPFDDAEIDRAVAYARNIGAEPMLQVPLLLDTEGNEPTSATAAAMVQYVNVSKGYGIKYFSIGNEPDIYSQADQTPLKPGYTPAQFCASATDFVSAMRAVDPTIRIIGPELSYKYFSGADDWLTPILSTCGALFDVVSVHRYPISPSMCSIAAAEADAADYKATLGSLRQKLAATGMADKPLAVTEANITWNGDPDLSLQPASPGTLPAGLWMADNIAIGLESGLWTFTPWSVREAWTLSLLIQNNIRRPSYFAYQFFTDHFGPNLLSVGNPNPHVHLHASRDAADTTTYVIALNWDSAPHTYVFAATNGGSERASSTVTLDALSMNAIEMPDGGAARVWSYTSAQWKAWKEPVER